MGSHSADPPQWFPPEDEPPTNEIPVTEPQWQEPETGPGRGYGDYHPVGGHTGTDYALPSRRQLHHQDDEREKMLPSEMVVAIIFGTALGFFLAGVIYLSQYLHTANGSFRQAALIFSGTGMVLSGIVCITMATLHIYRTRKGK